MENERGHPITAPPSDSPVSRTPELVLLGVLVALVAGALAFGGSEEAPEAGLSRERIALVQRRVEALRGLRFKAPVPVRIVSAEQARAYGMAEQRRTELPARVRAGEEAAKLLALLPPEVDVEALVERIFAEEVAGFYDSRRKRLMLVRGAGVDEVTLAHELTHALEDQHFGIEDVGGRPYRRLSDDALVAYTALLEGTATEVMVRYMLRYPGSAPDLGDALGALGGVAGPDALPPYVMRGLLFPYLRGQTFVAELRHGEPGWELPDNALRHRPPVSTAEVLEPERWLRVERPAAVRLPADDALGRGWRRAGGSTFGQFETVQLLHESAGSDGARRAAAGWDGGRWALWRRGGWAPAGCAEPCRSRDALLIAWAAESAPAARRLAGALRRWARTVPAGSATALRVRGLSVRLALAPGAALARRLAGG